MGKKKQLFLGFTVKRAILHWASKLLVVHPYISEIDSTAAFQLLVHSQAMIMPGVSSSPCNAVNSPELQLHTCFPCCCPQCLKCTYFSVFVEICADFPQARSLNRLLNAAVWKCLWGKCLSWNTSCIFSFGCLTSVRAHGSAGALHTGRNPSWVWGFGSSWEGLNISRRKWQPCSELLLEHHGASWSSPKSEGLSWLYTLLFFLCYPRALCRFWIAVGRETHPQRCSFLCLQKVLSFGEGRYITLPKPRLWDWLWEYTVRQH